MKLKASFRLLADENVIAPAESFKSENERELRDRQSDSKRQQDTEAPTKTESSDESESLGNEFDQTEVRDTEEAAHTPADSVDDLPQTDGQFANAGDDPLIERIEGSDTTDDISVTEDGFNTYPDQPENGLAACDRLTADADPEMFGNAEQPMG